MSFKNNKNYHVESSRRDTSKNYGMNNKNQNYYQKRRNLEMYYSAMDLLNIIIAKITELGNSRAKIYHLWQ